MNPFLLEQGVEYSVTVFAGEAVVAGVVIVRTDERVVETTVFHDADEDLLQAAFVLHIAASSIPDHVHVQTAKRLTREAIERLRDEDERPNGENPSGRSVDDLPF